MRWLKRDRWKAGIAFVGVLLLLVFIVCVPVSAAGAYEGASRLATSAMGTVQATPTVDATVTALSKEQLTLQVKQLQSQQNQNNWLVNNSTALIAAVAAVIVALFGILQWAITARQAKDKDLKAQAEERFKTAVTALGDEKEGVQVGGAILLRSFLHKEDKKSYERYYTQVFDLAVAYLRLPRTPNPSEDPDGIPQSPVDPNTPLPLTTLRQALIMVFKEAFPLARERRKKPQTLESSFLQKIEAWLKRVQIEERFDPLSLDATHIQLDNAYLDATHIQLDNAYLVDADLEQVWMPQASLRKANLGVVHLRKANLMEADLREANLRIADLREANLSYAHLSRANLNTADLREADLSNADLRGANLFNATLTGAKLNGADLTRAVLYMANLENAQTLTKTDLRGVNGLKNEQLEACKAKGAIIDEAPTANASQSSISPSLPSQSNEAQDPSAPSAQGSIQPPDISESSTPSSKPGPES